MNDEPILVFSRQNEKLFLSDPISGKIYFSYKAHNRTENNDGDPLIQGSWGPAPLGLIVLSPPDFISDEFRSDFYILHFNSQMVQSGESLVREWGEFEEDEMGRVRFALGDSLSPPGSGNSAAWDRELLIHAGKTYDTLTKGCIRMTDEDIELFAADWIRCCRQGLKLNVIKVEP
jgi:hypothetical protein